MEKKPVRSRLNALGERISEQYNEQRRIHGPTVLWAYVAVSLLLHWLFGVDPAWSFFLGFLSVEASLAMAYSARDSKRSEEKLDRQMEKLDRSLDSMKAMQRNQINLTEAVLSSTREDEQP